MATVIISTRIPQELYEAIRQKAATTGKTRNSIILKAIQQSLRKHHKPSPPLPVVATMKGEVK